MVTKNLFATLMLAVLTAASLNATAMAQARDSTGTQLVLRTAKDKQAPFLNPQTPADVRFLQSLHVMAPDKRWMIGANRTGNVLPKINRGGTTNGEYNLKGKDVRKFLQYEKQGTWRGINVGWTDNASASTATKRAQWSFRRQFDQAEAVPLVYGERVSLAWGRGSKPYVKYANRNAGIDLDWSSKPAVEWTILGGKPGTRVRRGQDWVILFNIKHKRALKYYDRRFGGDIGWGAKMSDDTIKGMMLPGSY